MKLSLKFLGTSNNEDQQQHNTQIMTAKVPISIFNHPFTSSIKSTTTTNSPSSEFSFSLSTNFPSGPSFKLSYSPTSTSSLPFSLSLKSGLGIFGSPRNSPLLFSLNVTLPPSSQNPIPTFFLHFKPQFGHFSLNKTVISDPKNTHHPPHSPTVSLDYNSAEFGKGFVADGSSSSVWQDLKLEPFGDSGNGFVPESSLVEKKSEKYGLSPDVAVMATTAMPVTKGLVLNFRWGLNFPGNLGLKMPYLTVNKIGLERVVEEVKQNKESKDTSDSDTDLQLLKRMCFWMTRDLENVEKENREIERALDEMKVGVSTRNHHREGRKLSQNSGESSSKFEHWRSKKSGKEEDGQKEPIKSQILVSDVESELQKAIKVASS